MFLRGVDQPTNPWTCAQTKHGLAASLPSFAAPHEGRPAVAAAALPDVTPRPHAARRLHRRPSTATAAVTAAAGGGADGTVYDNAHSDGGSGDFASRLNCLRKSIEHQGHDRSAFPKPPLAVTLRAIASPPPPPPACSTASAAAGGAPRRTLHCRCCAARHAAAGGSGGGGGGGCGGHGRPACARLTHGAAAATNKAGTAALSVPAAAADAAAAEAEAEAEEGSAAAAAAAGLSPSFLSAAVLRMNEAWQPRHAAVLQTPPQVRLRRREAAAAGGGADGQLPGSTLQQARTTATKTPQQVEHTLRELSKVVHDLRQRVSCGSQPPERPPRLSFHVAPDGEVTGTAADAAAAAADAKAKARRQAAGGVAPPASVRMRPVSPDEGEGVERGREAAAAAAQPPPPLPRSGGGGGGGGVQQKQAMPAGRVRRVSSVARWRLLGSEDKQALAQRRREAQAKTFEASLARTGKALEERLGRTEANKRRLERNKKTPQQKDWLALCAHAARVGGWGRAVEEGRARRSDADSDNRRLNLLRKVFMRYFIRRRAKREKAERRVLQFARMWRMRRARQMYAHHATVVRRYLQGVREMGIVKQNVSRYLTDVRACQACVRRFLTRQKAQLELTALHFNDVEGRLVEEVQRGTVVHDVAWLRREIRQNLLMKNLTAPAYKSHKDVNMAALEDAVAPFVAHQQQRGADDGGHPPSSSSAAPPPVRVPNPAQATRFTFAVPSAAPPLSPLSPASHGTAAPMTPVAAAEAAAAATEAAAASQPAAAAAPVATGPKGKPGRKKGKGGAQGGGGGGGGGGSGGGAPKAEAVVDEATKARHCDCLDLLGQFGADRLKDDGLRRLGEQTGLIVKRPFVQADVKRAYLKRVVKLRAQQYASAVEEWRRSKEKLRAAQQIEEARCMLSGEKGAVSVVPPRPHLRLFMPREEMLALVNHCRLAMGLFVANVQV